MAKKPVITAKEAAAMIPNGATIKIGRASCRERV